MPKQPSPNLKQLLRILTQTTRNTSTRPRRTRRAKTTVGSTVLALLFAAALYIAQQQGWLNSAPHSTPNAPSPNADAEPLPRGEASGSPYPSVQTLHAKRAQDTLTQGAGRVVKVLPDDNDGSRHQRFLVEVTPGLTIKLSHNIDLAPRVPAEEGDTLRFQGDYIYNDLGGVVHWTHHDPRNRRIGGWIELDEKRYE